MSIFDRFKRKSTESTPGESSLPLPASNDAVLERELEEMRSRNAQLEQTRLAVMNILEDVAASERSLNEKTTELKKFKQAVDSSFNHLIITDQNGVILYANPAAEMVTGYSSEEMVGQTPALWGKQMPKGFYDTFWETIRERKIEFVGEITNRRKNGQMYLSSVRVTPILDDKGDIEFFVGIERDITEERNSQLLIVQHAAELETINASLLKEKERAESILNFLKSIGEAVVAVDADGKVIFVNKVAEDIIQKSAEDILGYSLSDVVRFTREKDGVMHKFLPHTKALQRGTRINLPDNFFLVRDDKRKIPIAGSAAPIRDSEQRVVGTITVFKDATEERELDQMKNSFISIAAHQLRTPLGSMRWSMELLLSGDFGKLPKTAIKALEDLYSNSQRLVNLVNDLLQISRIESKHGNEVRKLSNIVDIVRLALSPLEPGAQKNGITIVTKFPKNPLPNILISPEHTREAFENLIANAIKYTPPAGIVTIKISKQAKRIIVSISDTGIGIPEHEQSSVFSKFFRGSNAVHKVTEGTGLGLSLVKSYIEESGGLVRFESKENVGTTFFVEYSVDPAARIS